MTTYTHTQSSDFLTRIAQYLMIDGSFIDNLGLLTGKMGIVVFFFHYSRYTNDAVYGEFAGELLDEVYEEIHTDTPIGFASGLCGIAWGILHLIENGFVDADPDEVLCDIDQAIMKYDIRRIRDVCLDTGLLGISHYVFQRKTIDNVYFQELISNMQSHNLQRPKDDLLKTIVKKIEIGDDIFEQKLPSLGIARNGMAGMGLKLIFERNGSN